MIKFTSNKADRAEPDRTNQLSVVDLATNLIIPQVINSSMVKNIGSLVVDEVEDYLHERGMSVLEVIDKDDRQKVVDNLNRRPYDSVACLKMHMKNGKRYRGTGWLAGPKTIITAGHNVYSRRKGGWADLIEVIPGRDGRQKLSQKSRSNRFRALDAWIEDRDPDFDIGVIQLNNSFQRTFKQKQFKSVDDDQLEKQRVQIVGYPQDKDAGEKQYTHTSYVKGVEENRIYYDVDTSQGQSGAPIWLKGETEEDDLVVGVHAYDSTQTPAGLGEKANSAPRITKGVELTIKEWVQQNP